MRHEARALVSSRLLFIEGRLILLPAEFRDGAHDRIIKTKVQHAKVVRADRLVQFNCELGNGLTDVAVVTHDV